MELRDLENLDNARRLTVDEFVSLSSELSFLENPYIKKQINEASIKTLYELYGTANPTILKALIARSNLPDEILNKVFFYAVDRNDTYILDEIAKRPNLNSVYLDKIYKLYINRKLPHPVIFTIIITIIINNLDPSDIVIKVLNNPAFEHNYELMNVIWDYLSKCPQEQLYNIVKEVDLAGIEQYGYGFILRNPNISPETVDIYIAKALSSDRYYLKESLASYKKYNKNQFLLLAKANFYIDGLDSQIDNFTITKQELMDLINYYREYRHIVPEEVFRKLAEICTPGSPLFQQELTLEEKNMIYSTKTSDYIRFSLQYPDALGKETREYQSYVHDLCWNPIDDYTITLLSKYCTLEDVLIELAYSYFRVNLENYLNIINNKNLSDAGLYLVIKTHWYKKYDHKIKSERINDLIEKYDLHVFGDKQKKEELLKEVIKLLESILGKKEIKSDTSLIQLSDRVEFNEDGTISIYPENFDLIEHQFQDKEIVYGSFPYTPVYSPINSLLNVMLKEGLLTMSSSYHYLTDNDLVSAPVFTFNDTQYVRIKNHKGVQWYTYDPIKWKINTENRSLDMEKPILDINKHSKEMLEYYLSSGFRRDVLLKYEITPEEEKLRKLLEDKEKNAEDIKALEELKRKNMQQQQEKKDKYLKVLALLSELKDAIDLLDNKDIVDMQKAKNKVLVPEDVLLIRVDDHLEFNPDYIPYLNFINLSFVTTENLKLSGLDLSQTNLTFDPQKIYNRDLSNCILSDNNVMFGNFALVDLRGAIVSEETESIGFEDAIIDENTRLPISNIKRH